MKTAIVLLLLLCRGAQAAGLLEEVIVTATRVEQQIQTTSSNISTISAASLQRVSHTHLNEAMQRVSGVWLSRGNGQESLTAIRSPVLTGAGGCGAFLATQDGIPLQASGFCNVNEIFAAHSEIAGRIEVIKGPGSALHGSNAMHGLINIITPGIVPRQTGTDATLEGGPHDYVRMKLNHREKTWRLDLSGTSDGGYKHDSGFDQQKATLKFANSLAPFDITTTLSMSNLNQQTAGFVQGFEAYKTNKKDNPNPEAFRNVSTFRANSRWTRALAGGGTLTLTPYFRYLDMAFLQHFLPGQALEENAHTSLGMQSSWQTANGWIMGIDAERTFGFLKETQTNPTPGFLAGSIPVGKHYDYVVQAATLAGFTQYSLELSAHAHLRIGARYEYVRYEYDNRMLSGRSKDDGMACASGACRFNRPEDRTDSFSNFSPKLGFTYNIGTQHQLYLHLAEGFRAPQATELYRLQGEQHVSSIDTEVLSSLEMGIRGGDRLAYDVSTYVMRKNNFIFRDTTRMNVDNGKTRHRGIEVSLTWELHQQLTANLFYSAARHEYANNPALASTSISGNDIDTAPRTMGSANINWRISPRANIELEWVHMNRYYTDPQNLASYKGHDLVNIRASSDVATRWSVFARLMNASDEDYAERADFGFGNQRYFVGEPRSLYIGIRGAF